MKFDRVDLKSDVLANAPQRSSIHAHSDCFVALIASIFNKELNADIIMCFYASKNAMYEADGSHLLGSINRQIFDYSQPLFYS